MSRAKTTATGIIILLIVSCLIMYYVENSFNGYIIKSLWKIGAFALLPLNSWLVHMFANFSINTVGFIMFGII